MANLAETAYQEAGDKAGRIKKLVLDNLYLVHRLADRLSAQVNPTVSRDDLIGAATLGLVEAAHRFDESKGVRFRTFAYQRIKGAMVDHLRHTDWLSKSARRQLENLREAIDRFQGNHGRKPTIEELATAMGMTRHDVLEHLSYEKWDRVSSLDQTAQEDEGHQNVLAGLAAGDLDTPLDKLQWKEKVECLTAAIRALPERQEQIIVMYYYEELYMSEMAEVFSISESRVSQLHTAALYNLARMLEE
ncbi:MAG: FliA/WhiG family RNA polymerase sigma factor [Candidatus Brocadiae bacterium]|nr:FliA/WhiG family RNA polymerase sigma factor [Candidatus Brocadiia bacterium]